MMKNYDISIVGNGIIAYSICYSLLELDKSLRIAVVAKNPRRGSATMAAGAMLNCFAEITSLSLYNETAKSLFDISLTSLRMWDEWVSRIKEQSKFKDLKINPGTFVIHNAKSGALDSTHFDAIVEALNSYNEPYEKVSYKEIKGYNPVADCRALEAIYLPNEGAINPSEMLAALQEILLKSGRVDFIDDDVTSLTSKNGLFEVNTHNFNLVSKQLLIAAGSYSQKLIENFPEISGSIPRILAGVGYSVIMEQTHSNKIENVIRTPNRAGACGLHALPIDGSKNLYIGATNNVALETEELTKAALSYFLLECGLEQINQELHRSRIQQWNVGNRPVTLDGYPLIGQTSIPGLWIASGTYRDGFHKSPFIAQHMANEMLGRKGLIDHDLFKPERKFIRGMSIEESIQETVDHFMSGSYEWGMKLPKIGYDQLLRNLTTERLEKIYQELDIDFGLNPDLMIMLYFAEDQKNMTSYLNDALRAIA